MENRSASIAELEAQLEEARREKAALERSVDILERSVEGHDALRALVDGALKLHIISSVKGGQRLMLHERVSKPAPPCTIRKS